MGHRISKSSISRLRHIEFSLDLYFGVVRWITPIRAFTKRRGHHMSTRHMSGTPVLQHVQPTGLDNVGFDEQCRIGLMSGYDERCASTAEPVYSERI
jgi:hypothetical protein